MRKIALYHPKLRDNILFHPSLSAQRATYSILQSDPAAGHRNVHRKEPSGRLRRRDVPRTLQVAERSVHSPPAAAAAARQPRSLRAISSTTSRIETHGDSPRETLLNGERPFPRPVISSPVCREYLTCRGMRKRSTSCQDG